MNIIFETDELRLENEYENAYLVEKSSGKILMDDDFYGDPTCGLVDINNHWAIIAGEHITVWSKSAWGNVIKRNEREDLGWIHALRQVNSNTVQILIDPWSEKSAVWEINPISLELKKLRDFDDYKNKEYSDIVIW